MKYNTSSNGVYVGTNSAELNQAAAAQINLGRTTPSRTEEQAEYPEIIDTTNTNENTLLGSFLSIFQR